MDKCPICRSPLIGKDESESEVYIYNCYRCGEFKITDDAIKFRCRHLKDKQIAYISGWIRENHNVTITKNLFDDILYNLKLPSLQDRATNLLKSFTYPYDLIGGRNVINFENLKRVLTIIENDEEKEYEKFLASDLKYMAVTWSYDIKELRFIYKDYLMNEKKYLEDLDQDFCKITPKGWAYLESLRQANPESKKAFVAMWLTDEMKEICEKYIKTAAEDAGGYKAKSIDDKDFNGNIIDAVIGEIRSSKFVIADFTGNRDGVYYEAGFAYGLKKEVIFTCQKDWFNKFVKQDIEIKYSNGNKRTKNLNIFSQIHFDIDHSKFIRWENGEDLYEQLVKRIKATIT